MLIQPQEALASPLMTSLISHFNVDHLKLCATYSSFLWTGCGRLVEGEYALTRPWQGVLWWSQSVEVKLLISGLALIAFNGNVRRNDIFALSVWDSLQKHQGIVWLLCVLFERHWVSLFNLKPCCRANWALSWWDAQRVAFCSQS